MLMTINGLCLCELLTSRGAAGRSGWLVMSRWASLAPLCLQPGRVLAGDVASSVAWTLLPIAYFTFFS
jgi:hypothetical protein